MDALIGIVQSLLTGIQGLEVPLATLALIVVCLAMVTHILPFRSGFITLIAIAITFTAATIVNSMPHG
jgi:type IV secretory pathway VirB2 component (pilin)